MVLSSSPINLWLVSTIAYIMKSFLGEWEKTFEYQPYDLNTFKRMKGEIRGVVAHQGCK